MTEIEVCSEQKSMRSPISHSAVAYGIGQHMILGLRFSNWPVPVIAYSCTLSAWDADWDIKG
jgi:hypothetical protein